MVQAANSGDQWTDELKALAKVDKDKKTLIPLSSATEQAIKVWVVADKLYYASFDSTQGKYLLRSITFTGQCSDTSLTTQEACTEAQGTWTEVKTVKDLLKDFEAYTVSKSSTTGQIMVSGLDFTDNSYKTGTVDVSAEEPAISLKTELTGIIKSVLVLD